MCNVEAIVSVRWAPRPFGDGLGMFLFGTVVGYRTDFT